MEGKRAAAIVALCMIMLLSDQQQVAGQQQVASSSVLCDCYLNCYGDCRTHKPRLVCLPYCISGCLFPIKDKVAAPTSMADCHKICLMIHICGSAATDTSGITACVGDCTKNRSQYAKHL